MSKESCEEGDDTEIDFECIDESFVFSVNDEVFKVEKDNMGDYIEYWKSLISLVSSRNHRVI